MRTKNEQDKYGVIQTPVAKIKNNVLGATLGGSIGLTIGLMYSQSNLIRVITTVSGLVVGAYLQSAVRTKSQPKIVVIEKED
jgi:outer membrane lipoprotein SlyB